VPALDLTGLPDNPVKRVAHLHELDMQLRAEMYEAFREAYYQARRQGLLEYAIEVGPFSRTVAERLTREANEALGRTLRWHNVDKPTADQLQAARRFAKQWATPA
jgi:hypothetical protein